MSQENLYLENRKVLKVSGLNCIGFLNNILTSDISKLLPFETRPSALLSPQGRILFDLLISKNLEKTSDTESIFIEYDRLCEDDLFKKLNMYNLRKEVSVDKTKYKVFVTLEKKSSSISLIDQRFTNLNINIIRIYDEKFDKSFNDKQKFGFISWYDLLRYKLCIPEGLKEIEPNITLPLEINLDLLGGISFEKGCFIGQEVNARIKYKGLVKRKYVPIYFKNKRLHHEEFDEINNKKIFLKNEEIGEVITLSLNHEDDVWYGIAKIKLFQLYLFEQNNELEGDFFGSKIKIKFPKFMLPLPKKI